MRVIALQNIDLEKLKTAANERDDSYRRYISARNEYDALLKALARAHDPHQNYRLDDTGNFLVIGSGGEWIKPS